MTTPTLEQSIDMARESGILYAFVDRSYINDGIWANGYEWSKELHNLVTKAYVLGYKDAENETTQTEKD